MTGKHGLFFEKNCNEEKTASQSSRKNKPVISINVEVGNTDE